MGHDDSFIADLCKKKNKKRMEDEEKNEKT